MFGREYNKDRDAEAAHRIWIEVGWLTDEPKELESMDRFVAESRARVADIEGSPECLVLTQEGDYCHSGTLLPHCAVTSVTTSIVARRQGLAGRLTAESVAVAASEGAVVAGLGFFEQGYYDRLGFGCTVYEHWTSFDPALMVDLGKPRVPVRLTATDWEEVHVSRLERMRFHGSVSLHARMQSRGPMERMKKSYGLGYRDSSGKLTHHFFWNPESVNQGPFRMTWMAYQTPEQFRELLTLINSVGDQVHLVTLREPVWVQLQDFMVQPNKYRNVTRDGKFRQAVNSSNYHQIRICDLAKAVAAVHIHGEIAFNLTLSDPIERRLEPDAPWRGCAGEYTVVFGPESSVKRGHTAGLDTMETDVNSFSRLWARVLPATGIAVTGKLTAPARLLAALDSTLVAPNRPSPDWDY